MDLSSSDVEIVSAPPAKFSRANLKQPLQPTASTSHARPLARTLSNVIEITSDSDSDDDTQVVSGRGASMIRTVSAPGPAPRTTTSDDDLPDWRVAAVGGGLALGGKTNARSVSMTALDSNTNNANAARRAPTALKKGKGRAVPAKALSSDDEDDPYDAMMARGPQAKRRKRPKAADSDASDDASGAAKKGKKAAAAKPKKKAPRASLDDKESKNAAATTAKEAKEAEAERKKRLTTLNVFQGNRKLTVKEVVAHVAGTAFRGAAGGDWVRITNGLKERLAAYEAEIVVGKQEEDMESDGAVRWTRTCCKQWDERSGMFRPIDGPPLIVEEDSRLVFITASDISNKVANGTLLTHVQALERSVPACANLFIMIYGLQAHQSGAKKAKKEELELGLIRVQVATKCFIIQVEKAEEAMDWLEQFTMDVSYKPYSRLKIMPSYILGTAEEKIASGKDLAATFIKMLTCIKGVTESLAKAIVREYPTLRDLYESYAKCRSELDRREMLIGIFKGNKVDGTATTQAIGKTTSNAIYQFFHCRDANKPL